MMGLRSLPSPNLLPVRVRFSIYKFIRATGSLPLTHTPAQLRKAPADAPAPGSILSREAHRGFKPRGLAPHFSQASQLRGSMRTISNLENARGRFFARGK